MNIYEKYNLAKLNLNKFQAEESIAKIELIKFMKENETSREENDFGTFNLSTRTTKTINKSDRYKELESLINEEKESLMTAGEFTESISDLITFRV